MDKFKGECTTEELSDYVGPTDVELANAFGESARRSRRAGTFHLSRWSGRSRVRPRRSR